MSDQRKKNANWAVADANSITGSWEQAQVAVLMDIRDELQQLNHTIAASCLPGNLRRVRLILDRLDRRVATHAPLPKGRMKS